MRTFHNLLIAIKVFYFFRSFSFKKILFSSCKQASNNKPKLLKQQQQLKSLLQEWYPVVV